jgi:hypothetical protein
MKDQLFFTAALAKDVATYEFTQPKKVLSVRIAGPDVVQDETRSGS